MTFEENVRAILNCNFSETKEEIIEIAVKRICSVSNLTTIDDCISRKALKKVIETYRPIRAFDDYSRGKTSMVNYCLDEIDNAPIVDPKRPQGTWIRREDPRYSYDRENGHIMAGVSFRCSECDGMGDNSDAFCKHCGTPMKLSGNRI